MKEESKETMKDEMEESPSKQKKETKEGTEEHIVPEDFQQHVESMIKEHGHSKPRMEHARRRIDTHLDEMRQKEMEAKNKKKSKEVPSEYSSEAMPSSY